MHALRTILSGNKHRATHIKSVAINLGRQTMPIMKSSIRTRDTCVAGWQQRANYYYDASWHTRKTFRQLITSLDKIQHAPITEFGSCLRSDYLIQQTDFFLDSLQPFVNGVEESKEKYVALLGMHLSTLDQPELEEMLRYLRQLNYNCNITESTIDDKMYLEYGFCNGPPHTKKDTLLSTPEFFQLIERLNQSKKNEELTVANLPDITLDQAQTLRNQLSICAIDWMNSDKSLDCILRIARHLEYLVNGEITVETIDSYSDEPGPSKVIQIDKKLRIDSMIMYELRHTHNEFLFSVLLRDMLEIFLAKKIIGPMIAVCDLSAVQRRRVWNALDKISTLAPDPLQMTPFYNHVKTLLSSRSCFGKVHIIPASGVALGHAWIAPNLSVIPDQQKNGIAAGTHYLQSGTRLKAGITTIKEWPIRWLRSSENEELYPSRHAWLLAVPVTAPQLELAAQELINEWKHDDLPYRFVSVAPEKPATGCRISVWYAVEKAMDADTKLLFASFNRGLPLPDSTIELWERLHGFMQWLELIVDRCQPQSL